MEEFVPISNGDTWDLYLENLILKNEIQTLKNEIRDIKNPIYCNECGSCGEVAGCCDVHRCLYLNVHQGEYDNLVKENESLLLVIEKLGVEVTKSKESEAKWIKFYQDQVIDLNKSIDKLNQELSKHNNHDVGCPCCGM